jgi:hypothetical protein
MIEEVDVIKVQRDCSEGELNEIDEQYQFL